MAGSTHFCTVILTLFLGISVQKDLRKPHL
jgi:hypothetical protein